MDGGLEKVSSHDIVGTVCESGMEMEMRLAITVRNAPLERDQFVGAFVRAFVVAVANEIPDAASPEHANARGHEPCKDLLLLGDLSTF